MPTSSGVSSPPPCALAAMASAAIAEITTCGAHATSRRPIRLTIGVSGDLLPHLPVVARAHALGGRARLRLPADAAADPPLGAAQLARVLPRRDAADARAARRLPAVQLAAGARARGQGHGLRRLQHRLEPLGRPRPGGHRRHPAGAERAPACAHTGSFSSRRQQRQPLLLRARGVRVAFLAYTQMTNGIPLPHPWSVNLASAGRILRDARRARRAGARVVIVNLHWGTEYRHAPDAYQSPLARRLGRSRAITAVVGQHAHVVQPIRRVRPHLGRVRHGQPALEPERRMLRPRRARTACSCASISASARDGSASTASRTRRPGCAIPTTRSCAPLASSARHGGGRSRSSAATAASGRCPESGRSAGGRSARAWR